MTTYRIVSVSKEAILDPHRDLFAHAYEIVVDGAPCLAAICVDGENAAKVTRALNEMDAGRKRFEEVMATGADRLGAIKTQLVLGNFGRAQDDVQWLVDHLSKLWRAR